MGSRPAASLAPMRALADLLLPRACPCGASAADGRSVNPVCEQCHRLLTGGRSARVVRPYPAPPGLPECAAAVAYSGPARRLIIAYKERGRRDLVQILGLALMQSLLALTEVREVLRSRYGRLMLVPVPASRAAFRTRGVDNVAALAMSLLNQLRPEIGARIGWSQLLQHIRRVADQAGLNAAGRKRNVAGSLRIRAGGGPFATRRSPLVVVIDDVLTTGCHAGRGLPRTERRRGVRGGGGRRRRGHQGGHAGDFAPVHSPLHGLAWRVRLTGTRRLDAPKQHQQEAPKAPLNHRPAPSGGMS